ncbi:Hypothetical_protein [Hexamita inflata]|uniref:Hypothetical_protein n=1 Tax=Hexamita inflata TaxID=28002 RepID=A0AA86PXX4_9EUKA|nr:Hypothetical protein HINF_LOCUS35929 [Hexamita inflata]CAI9948287.1 Hypothetical protein HINF_LOCUS35932 [Hexamita inflata]CAI9948289.1 Hypothetical protein HINF_LOCUS35934 [Hexamita inflata]
MVLKDSTGYLLHSTQLNAYMYTADCFVYTSGDRCFLYLHSSVSVLDFTGLNQDSQMVDFRRRMNLGHLTIYFEDIYHRSCRLNIQQTVTQCVWSVFIKIIII